MGIFTRFKDIVSSNINAMLDKAEDPEKLIKLMIQEMEDTLVELKASCAGSMASKKRVARSLDTIRSQVEEWEKRAELAVEKGRDDLAREALAEKRRFGEELDHMEKEVGNLDAVITQYQSDIEQLETKLGKARQKRHALIQRASQAQKRYKAQTAIRKVDSSDAFSRFEAFENRIERMEADADLVNTKAKTTLEDEFVKLEGDEELEDELSEMKKKLEANKAES